MVAPYDNWENASQQLTQNVVLYDNLPVYIREIFDNNGSIVASITFLPRFNNDMNVSIFDEKFDAKGIGLRLGYCNCGEGVGAVVLARVPSRQYSQGLTNRNVRVIFNENYEGNRIDFTTIMRRASFVDMIRGDYPTFFECIKKLDEDPMIPSMAFSREFAIQKDPLGFYILLYKGSRVAWGPNDSFRLPNKFKYLSESLNKVGVKYIA